MLAVALGLVTAIGCGGRSTGGVAEEDAPRPRWARRTATTTWCWWPDYRVAVGDEGGRFTTSATSCVFGGAALLVGGVRPGVSRRPSASAPRYWCSRRDRRRPRHASVARCSRGCALLSHRPAGATRRRYRRRAWRFEELWPQSPRVLRLPLPPPRQRPFLPSRSRGRAYRPLFRAPARRPTTRAAGRWAHVAEARTGGAALCCLATEAHLNRELRSAFMACRRLVVSEPVGLASRAVAGLFAGSLHARDGARSGNVVGVDWRAVRRVAWCGNAAPVRAQQLRPAGAVAISPSDGASLRGASVARARNVAVARGLVHGTAQATATVTFSRWLFEAAAATVPAQFAARRVIGRPRGHRSSATSPC